MKVISVVGYKKSGKTTLSVELVKRLKEYGKVGTVKHLAHHSFSPAGTDTRRHFDAGAEISVGLGEDELLTLKKTISLEEVLLEFESKGIDFVIVEGFKDSSLPKIALGTIDVPSTLLKFKVGEEIDLDAAVNSVLKLKDHP